MRGSALEGERNDGLVSLRIIGQCDDEDEAYRNASMITVPTD